MKKYLAFLKVNILALLLICFISSCNKNGTKTESTSSGSSSTKDKWGGFTRDEYAKNSKSIFQKMLIEMGYAGKENELAIKLCNCFYDKETEYLEKTYGNVKKEEGNYRSSKFNEELNNNMLESCFKELKLTYNGTKF